MNTTSRKPDSVSSVNMTPAAPRSERTMCCTPADSATSRVGEALVHAVGDGAVVVQRGEDLLHRRAARAASPRTLRKVSCWPAKEASGRSSAVAEERTATAMSAAALMRAQLLADRLLERRRQRGRKDPVADARAGGGERASRRRRRARQARLRMRASRPPCARNSRKACAVVAKPPGTRTPSLVEARRSSRRARRSCRRPCSTSCMPSCSKGMT